PTCRDAQVTLVDTVELASLNPFPYAFNASIDSPSRRVTIAFFHSRAGTGRGAEPLRRIARGFPGMRMVLTLTTCTLNMASTARRTSILFACNATRKVYLFWACCATVLSVTMPWRSISVISTISILPRRQLSLRPQNLIPEQSAHLRCPQMISQLPLHRYHRFLATPPTPRCPEAQPSARQTHWQ